MADAKHTLPALVLNTGAVMFWSAIYERAFGHCGETGEITKAFAGAAAVAALAYVTDYQVVPKRLTPGWEERVSNRSLGLIYSALAVSLPLRGFWQFWSRRQRGS